jgi:hypothetical protein
MSRITHEELQAVYDAQNGRVGLHLEDKQGRSFWITDVSADGRFRVVSELGEACWWNEAGQEAVPIRKKIFRDTAKVMVFR